MAEPQWNPALSILLALLKHAAFTVWFDRLLIAQLTCLPPEIVTEFVAVGTRIMS